MKLSFKNFPFNLLYEYQNNQYTRPSQYISLWNYIIYSFICREMARNEAINPTVRTKLAALFPPDVDLRLQREIENWTSVEFNAQVLGTGGALNIRKDIKPMDNQWFKAVDFLEEIIATYIDDSNFFILFDELDEDYKEFWTRDRRQHYLDLLTSLFKACQSIRSRFPGPRYKRLPIIFLRDDIYDVIMDSDKVKWGDSKLGLEWDRRHIKEVLAFRLTRTAYAEREPYAFEDAWSLAFSGDFIGYGTKRKKKSSQFDFMESSTHLRPRDFIKYIRDCSELAIRQGHQKVYSDTIRGAEQAFANYLRDELSANCKE